MRQVLRFLLLVLGPALVYAQPNACSPTAVSQPIRHEGHAELIPTITLTCTGGTVTPNGDPVPAFDVVVTTSVNVTSQIIVLTYADAFLTLDDPGPSIQLACGNPAEGCEIFGNGTGLGLYNGDGGHFNLFQAEVTGPNELTFRGVPIEAAADQPRVLRIHNVRVNALGADAGTVVTATVAINGTNPPSIVEPVIEVALVQDAVELEELNPALGPNGLDSFTIRFTETFPTAWKRRSAAQFVDENTSPEIENQADPAATYPMSESGFVNTQLPETTGGPLFIGGTAQQGTRLRVMLDQIPGEATLHAPLVVPVMSGGVQTGVARKIVTSTNGGEEFNPSGDTVVSVFESRILVYEILNADPAAIETLSIPITVSYSMAPAVPLNQINGSGGLVPRDGTDFPATDLPHPRFDSFLPITVPDTTPHVNITTSSLPPALAGIHYGFQMEAADGTLPYTTWNAAGLPPGMGITSTGLLEGTPVSPGTFTVHITVVDANLLSDTKTFTLNIGENAPVINTGSLLTGTVGVPYSQFVAATGGTPPYTWDAVGLPGGLSIDAMTGEIGGTPLQAGIFNVTITVTDDLGFQDDRQYVLSIQPPPVMIATGDLPGATVGQPYSFAMAATGGTGSYSWQATGLPDGLSITAAGEITGTPTTAGGTNPTFTVTDSGLDSDQRQLFLNVNPAPLNITTLALPTGTLNTPYNFTVTATGGTQPYAWQATGLPNGLSMSANGQITGSPTEEGSFNVMVSVMDFAMETDSEPYTLTIAPGAPEIATGSLPNGTLNVAYNFAMTATGGTPGYTWQAIGLPSGLSITAAGQITGTPTQSGGFEVQFTVTDAAMLSGVVSLSLIIDPGPPSISTASLPNATLNAAYSLSMTAAGGTPPYTNWQASNLPPGLSINSAGLISGAPSQAGTFNVNFTVTDSAALSGMKQLPLTVQPGGPTVSTAALPAGTIHQPYSFLMSATGGTPPYTNWQATGLPSGLSINNTGQISGMPTQSGTFTVTITVTDTASLTGNKQFTLNIAPGGPRITTTSLPGGMVGAAYSVTLAATGGTLPYTTWSATGLPGGLLISSEGQIAGTPTQAGQFNVSVTVVDSASLSDTKQFTLAILQPLMFVTSTTLPRGVAGTPYSVDLFASGGTPPYEFGFDGPPLAGFDLTPGGSLTGTPPAPGDFAFSVRVRDAAQATATAIFELSVDSASPPFQSSSASLMFESLAGGDTPPAKSLTLVPVDGQAQSYAVSANVGTATGASATGGRAASSVPWLTIDPEQGDVPGRFTVAVNPEGLAEGSYNAVLSVTSPGDLERPPLLIPVQLTVTAKNPELEALPAGLRFEAKTTAPGQQSATIAVRNRGGGGPVAFSATVLNRSTWIESVTPESAQTEAGTAIQVQVTVDSTGLAPGQYRDTIRISSAAGTQEIPVNLLVSEGGPRLDLSVRGVLFSIREGNGLSTTRQVRVINRGELDSTVQWTAQIERGGEWLELVNDRGSAVPGRPDTLTLRLKRDATGLEQGPKYALVRVSDPQAQGSPQYLTAVLSVVAPTQPSLLDLERAGGVFIASPGSAVPATQQFTIGTSSVTPVPFQAAAATIDGEDWLTVSPESGFVSSTLNAQLTVSANAAHLPPGIYRGEVVLARSGAVRSLNITFIVADPVGGAVLPAGAASPGNARAATCTPNALALTHTGMPNNFSVPAGWPATLAVNVNDNCGRPVTGASVIASFTNGDPPLTLTDDGTGTYSATWQPGAAGPQVNVNVRASAAGLGQATAQVIGDVTQNRVPRLAPGGTLHNINPQVGAALAPGLVVAIFGSDLATVTESTGQVPLAKDYKGTSVFIGGTEAPLYFVSPGQLVAQLPVELRPNRPYSIVVSVGPALTIPDTVDLVAVQPGIAVFPDGRLIAQHSDFTLVDEERPARRGETLVMYLIGLGVTDPLVPAGNPSPGGTGLTQPVTNVELTIDGQTVPVAFAGLTPSGVGLFQINFSVPAETRTGVPLEVVVRQGNTTANVATLTVVE